MSDTQLTCEQLVADSTPLTTDQWAARWQQEAEARNAMFRELMAITSERDDMERKLTICRAALCLREHEMIPEQLPRAGSLQVDDGSTRRRIYADGEDLERKLAIARDALRCYENAVIAGGRYAAREALEETKP